MRHRAKNFELLTPYSIPDVIKDILSSKSGKSASTLFMKKGDALKNPDTLKWILGKVAEIREKFGTDEYSDIDLVLDRSCLMFSRTTAMRTRSV